MQPLDIIVAPRGSTMTLRTLTFPGDVPKYMIVLKRFVESGGGAAPVAVWEGADAEEKGIAATLDDANGFEIIILAKTKVQAPTKMRAELAIGDDYRFDHIITLPTNDVVGWPVVMKDMVKQERHD